jgi:hypothetical protein
MNDFGVCLCDECDVARDAIASAAPFVRCLQETKLHDVTALKAHTFLPSAFVPWSFLYNIRGGHGARAAGPRRRKSCRPCDLHRVARGALCLTGRSVGACVRFSRAACPLSFCYSSSAPRGFPFLRWRRSALVFFSLALFSYLSFVWSANDLQASTLHAVSDLRHQDPASLASYANTFYRCRC